MTSANWTDAKLWKLIEARPDSESRTVAATLHRMMPTIVTILAKGGVVPTDFTLHDDGHAYRVARRMVEIIKPEVLNDLSTYELALLLLAAYLHDIGMSPDQGRVQRHYNYLLTGDASNLPKDEIESFQRFLDDQDEPVDLPLKAGTSPSSSQLILARRLVFYYTRERHNEWSAEWMREHLAKHPFGEYTNWLHDLVNLCSSHHWGYEKLASELFDPRFVGSKAATVHLRYLAAVLRLADILEFDIERTPEVLLHHRDVAQSSLVHWWKNFYLSLQLKDRARPFFSAYPPNATMHFAVETMADSIDDELALCRKLAIDIGFDKYKGTQLPHTWDLPALLERDIKPQDNAYEYINGTFRPNTRRLLQLLAGTQLYHKPIAAVRELLQNAFDAVKEQIAYERLRQISPADPSLERTLGSIHRVELKLVNEGPDYWLVCRDDGVGMSKQIIQNYLLISGQTRRRDIEELKRNAQKAGFTLTRTGEFGIGILSYFMLADEVEIRTRRSQYASDATEPNAWEFRTSGVSSFGELRKIHDHKGGTHVRLRLRPEILEGDPIAWFGELEQYLHEILVTVPCKVILSTEIGEHQEFSWGPGWAKNEEQLTSLLLERVYEGQPDVKRRQGSNTTDTDDTSGKDTDPRTTELERLAAEVKSSILWQSKEIDIITDDGVALGRCRMSIPVFNLAGGASLGYLRVHQIGTDTDSTLVVETIAGRHVFFSARQLVMAWKGMYVDLEYREDSLDFQNDGSEPGILEIDWYSGLAGSIAVDRSKLLIHKRANAEADLIMTELSTFLEQVVSSNRTSKHTLLNATIAQCHLPPGPYPLYWFTANRSNSEDMLELRELKFPMVVGASGTNTLIEYTWRDTPVQVALDVQRVPVRLSDIRSLARETVTLPAALLGPQYLVAAHTDPSSAAIFSQVIDYMMRPLSSDRSNPREAFLEAIVELEQRLREEPLEGDKAPSEVSYSMYGLWTEKPPEVVRLGPLGAECKFPPAWQQLCGAGISLDRMDGKQEMEQLWNNDHPLVRHIDLAAVTWATEVFKEDVKPLPFQVEIIQSKARAAAWLATYLRRGNATGWEEINTQAPTFLRTVWQLLFGARHEHNTSAYQPLMYWLRHYSDHNLVVATPGEYLAPDKPDITKYLPIPGEEWLLRPSIPPRPESE